MVLGITRQLWLWQSILISADLCLKIQCLGGLFASYAMIARKAAFVWLHQAS